MTHAATRRQNPAGMTPVAAISGAPVDHASRQGWLPCT